MGVKEIEPSVDAVATYIPHAAVRLSAVREDPLEHSPSMSNPQEAEYANGFLVELQYLTDDVKLMTKASTGASAVRFNKVSRTAKLRFCGSSTSGVAVRSPKIPHWFGDFL